MTGGAAREDGCPAVRMRENNLCASAFEGPEGSADMLSS
ncbi:hypothetical protein C8D96_0615 [Kushneria marisflavi]|nr:hypothetical protein C8D96_0615 [Kushneria marisflavi]